MTPPIEGIDGEVIGIYARPVYAGMWDDLFKSIPNEGMLMPGGL